MMDDELKRMFGALQEQIAAENAETRKEFAETAERLRSHFDAELERRVQRLEKGFSNLETRVERLEATTH